MNYQQQGVRSSGRTQRALTGQILTDTAAIAANQQRTLTQWQKNQLYRRGSSDIPIALAVLGTLASGVGMVIFGLWGIIGLFTLPLRQAGMDLVLCVGLFLLMIFLAKLASLLKRVLAERFERHLQQMVIEQVQGEIVWSGQSYIARAPGLQFRVLKACTLPAPGPYHFFYVAGKNILLSAQPIHTFTQALLVPGTLAASGLPGDAQAHMALQQALCQVFHFTTVDLIENRIGRFSTAQSRRLTRAVYRQMRNLVIGNLFLSLFLLLFLLVFVFNPQWITTTLQTIVSSWREDWYLILFVALMVLGYLALVVGQLAQLGRRVFEIRHTPLQSVEGPVMCSDDGDSENTIYFYEIGAERFTVSETAHSAMITGTRCRLYFFGRTRTLLSVEVLEAPSR